MTHPDRDHQRGRIWRIRYTGQDAAPYKPGPDLTKASLDALIGFLSDENLVVRTHATHQLVHRIGRPAGRRIKSMLAGGLDARQRAHGTWVLARLGALDAQSVRRLAEDGERLVRVHLMKALAERTEWHDGERVYVRRALTDNDAFVRRAAVDALGGHPHPGDITPLIDLWNGTGEEDTHLIHATRIALRDVIEALKNLPALALLYAGQPEYLGRVADICPGIRNAQSAQFLLDYHRRIRPEGTRLSAVIHHIGRYVETSSLPAFYRWVKAFNDDPEPVRLRVIETAQRAAQERGDRLPADLIRMAKELAMRMLAGSDPKTVRSALGIVREFRIKEAAPALVAMVTSPDRPGDSLRHRSPGRGRAPVPLEALVAVDEAAAVSTFVSLLRDVRFPSGIRWRMELAIGKMQEPASYEALIKQLRVSSEVVETTLVRGLSRSIGGVRALFAAIEQGRLSPRILRDPRVSVNLQYAGIPDLDNRLAELIRDLPKENEDVYNLIAERRAGFLESEPDLNRGKEVFVTVCAVCHQLDGEGGRVGPQLDGVGIRGLDRLLEDIIDPSRNVGANFRATNIILKDGQLVSGRVMREAGEVVVMMDQQGIERRIPKAAITKRQPLKLPSMPANISELMKQQAFYDLIGFLLGHRP